jgi:GNAT-family acetyltransferase (TIGR03103 family)
MPSSSSSRKHRAQAMAHRMVRLRDHALKPPVSGYSDAPDGESPQSIAIDCGWGRLLIAPTFKDADALVEALRDEQNDRRDIAFYVRDPHVLLAAAPQELFLDPSHTYRLDLQTFRAARRRSNKGFFVRRLSCAEDADAVNRIYLNRKMIPIPPDFFWSRRNTRALIHLVAEDDVTGAILGTVTALDHFHAFDDPQMGASMWCLAVDSQCTRPGVGEALVRHAAEHFQARGAQFLDLSVLHDNELAIGLYEKLGFVRVPFFAVKRKNGINERLFIGTAPDDGLNPYARLIVNEARRRGISVDITDGTGGFFRMTYGGRSVMCRESLSEMTSAVAMSMCDDKAVTRRMMEKAGVAVPEQMDAGDMNRVGDFLEKHGSVVVKPARGEQGRGIAVGVTTMEEVEKAIAIARTFCETVLIEQCVSGDDLRLIVIDYKLVAAAIRKPAQITGDGTSTIKELIEHQSRRRAAATGGESTIPLDSETERCIAAQNCLLKDVLDQGVPLTVRRTANLHTGGTIHDVTDEVHPVLVEAAIRAARALNIPVVGIDFMVKSPREPDYAFIEANERPGLANHEPQPTAERFVDLMFPLSMPAGVRTALAS